MGNNNVRIIRKMATLRAETFAGRNFRGQKLSRAETFVREKKAKFLKKAFANDNFWDKFCGKNFGEAKIILIYV